MARNNDPSAPWNHPAYRDDPSMPHNDTARRDDPTEPWNSYGGQMNESDADRYGR